MQESRSRRGDCWAWREVTLATETGHPYRGVAQPGGKGMGLGGHAVLGANSSPSALQLGDLG